VVSFVVNKEGIVCDPVILRDIGYGCDEESIRIVNLMPRWTPGYKDGHSVNVRYNLPIKFRLED